MNTIPNRAPDMHPELLTIDEVKELVHDDDFVWVELRHNGHDLLEDESFHLRVGLVHKMGLDLCTPFGAVAVNFDKYNKTWRIWNICPDWDNLEIWEDGE